MTDLESSLPESVHKVTFDGKVVHLIGTAHVSKESVEDVTRTVAAVEPDTICVELCEGRHKAITQRDNWKKMNIFKIIKEKKAVFLLAQLMLSSFYRRLGDQLGVMPGAEMVEGIQLAEKTKANLVLADRNVEITLKRVWGYLNLWNKSKMIFQLLMSVMVAEKIDEAMIEEVKQKDQLENMMESFSKSFPVVKNYLIDERDIFLAQKIRSAPGKNIVAIVGAGHVPGIKQHITKDEPIDQFLELPPKSIVPKIIGWGVPALIVLLFVVGFIKGGAEQSIESVYIWFLVNGILSALGVALAFGHPLTILSAFIGAPITSLNPTIAAGWVAGLVQAWVKKPTVEDLENLPVAISTFKGFWTNPVCRILLVVVLANIGSSIGTFVAGSWIAAKVL